MALDLENLKKAVVSLQQVVERSQDNAFMEGLDDVAQNAIRAGVIQHFELTFELCWKFMQRWLRLNTTPEDVNFPRTRKELFRIAGRYGLINDPIPWFEYSKARNLTSHIYDEETVDSVYETAVTFVPDAQYLLQQLEQRNN